MADQTIDEVYANVVDYGAASGVNSAVAIQLAIDSGRHVLVPAGTFWLGDGLGTGPSADIDFHNDFQNVTFLAGAELRPLGDHARIRARTR